MKNFITTIILLFTFTINSNAQDVKAIYTSKKEINLNKFIKKPTFNSRNSFDYTVKREEDKYIFTLTNNHFSKEMNGRHFETKCDTTQESFEINIEVINNIITNYKLQREKDRIKEVKCSPLKMYLLNTDGKIHTQTSYIDGSFACVHNEYGITLWFCSKNKDTYTYTAYNFSSVWLFEHHLDKADENYFK